MTPAPCQEPDRIRILVNGLHAKSGGGITYLRNIVPHLAEDPRLELHLFLHADQCKLFLPLDERVRLHVLDFHPRLWSLLLWEQVSLPVVARLMSADVTFSPANFGPLFAPNPTILLRNATAVGNMERRLVKRFYWIGLGIATAASLLTARRAIAVSDYARRTLGLVSKRQAARKITIVHHGVDERFSPEPAGTGDAPPFLLAVSDIYIQKNLHTLLRALPRIRAAVPDITLRIAGRTIDQGYFRELKSIIERESLGDAVVFLGNQPLERLLALYRGCAVFVFPSTVETFGNPLAEAMSCGAAIACSNTAAMPEIVGNAALLFDPRSADDMAGRILDILTDPARAEALRKQARERGRRYSWAETARKTADVLVAAAGERRRGAMPPAGEASGS